MECIMENHCITTNKEFAKDVFDGLNKEKKQLPSRYFYDDKGSELFQKITRHSDYYLTRTDVSILKQLQKQLPELVDANPVDIIELGAGDGHKSELVLDSFLRKNIRVNFFPIDISKKALDYLAKQISHHPNLNIDGVEADYMTGLNHVQNQSTNKKLILFLGSTIGNFNRTQARMFLKELNNRMIHNDMILVGFDMKKEKAVLEAAYNDSSGLTKDFNLNLLTRINRELGGHFQTASFEHKGIYNDSLGSMESFLISTKSQDIAIDALSCTFHFEKDEAIHTEYSFKYSDDDIQKLCRKTGFDIVSTHTDDEHIFTNAILKKP